MKLRKVPLRGKTVRNVNNVYTRNCFCNGHTTLAIWGTPYDARIMGHNNIKRRMANLWKERYRFAVMFSGGNPWIRSSADEAP